MARLGFEIGREIFPLEAVHLLLHRSRVRVRVRCFVVTGGHKLGLELSFSFYVRIAVWRRGAARGQQWGGAAGGQQGTSRGGI